jgi:hypothetical protein
VYSVDEGGMIGLARQINQANEFQDRVVFVKGLSTRVDLPERVDVIVADQIGQFGFNAGLLEYFSDARDRFLKPGGRMVPASFDLIITAVESPAMWKQVEFWNTRPVGFNFSPAHAIAANTGYPTRFRPEELLSEQVPLISFDLMQATSAAFKRETRVRVARDGMLHGIGGWFSAQLSPSVVMTNSPLAADAINRRQIYFPVDEPVEVKKDECVRMAMHVVPTESLVSWTVEVWNGGGGNGSGRKRRATFRHSTFKGMLLCGEDLQRTRPAFVPKLSPWGDARLSVLTLCDGQRPLAEIEKEVYRRHPKLFRSPAEAATFVAEVVTRYTQ